MTPSSKPTKKPNFNLQALRHTTEHVLMQALDNLYPGKIKKALGPATNTGFYYDFDADLKISETDFPKIEAEMKKIIDQDLPLIQQEINPAKARELFKNNPYKQEWIKEAESRGETLSVYWTGKADQKQSFIDLCSGPHLESTGQIKAFKLLSLAGAYWRGDEKNKMLARIYGTAFANKKELNQFLWQQEESQKRDHRKLNQGLGLFTFAKEIGPGLPLWLPKGTIIKEELEKWGKETEKEWGYQRVSTPFLAKKELFTLSAHIPYFEEEMYQVTVPGKDKKEQYYLRPMNCPFHHLIYKSQTRSYKNLPLKLAEYGTVARYEDRGSINGILRPRLFCQNDAHVYCTKEQSVDVFVEIINLHRYYYDTLKLKDYHIVLALRDPQKKDKYHGQEELWQESEKLSIQAMEKANINYTIENEGAAHYGPKMDFKIKSAIKTEYGISTNQIDLFMPQRFNLKYTDKSGQKKFVVVQHRAPLGSSERFIGFLTEHFAAAFPLWLAPIQVAILPLSDKYLSYAQKLEDQFKQNNIRSELDNSSETLSKKVRQAESQKIPYMLIVGNKEARQNLVSLRQRGEKDLGQMTTAKFIDKITAEINQKVIF